MMAPITFFVAGEPQGQPRIKASSQNGKVRCYTPTTVKNKKTGVSKDHPAHIWKSQVIARALEMRLHQKLRGPLCVNLTFYFSRPKSHYTKAGQLKPDAPHWHDEKPDRDNADKCVLDALTTAGMWEDDKQVCAGFIHKIYVGIVLRGAAAIAPGCFIEIREPSFSK